MYRSLGIRIKQHRVLARITQEELARSVGISTSFVGHIERGTRKASLDTLVRISNVLKVSPNVLLQDSLEEETLKSKVPNDSIAMGKIVKLVLEYLNM